MPSHRNAQALLAQQAASVQVRGVHRGRGSWGSIRMGADLATNVGTRHGTYGAERLEGLSGKIREEHSDPARELKGGVGLGQGLQTMTAGRGDQGAWG